MVHAQAKAVAVGLVVLGSLLVAPPTAQAAPHVGAAEQETILALHNQYRAAAGVTPPSRALTTRTPTGSTGVTTRR